MCGYLYACTRACVSVRVYYIYARVCTLLLSVRVYYIYARVCMLSAQTYSAPQTAVECPHSASRYDHIGLEVVIIDKT